MPNTIKTISIQGESLFKDKGSKHFGFVFNVNSENEAKTQIEAIRQQHPKANHHCFSYIIKDGNQVIERYNDDGEPNNSAGLPIFNQLKKYELLNTCAVVVRYFGGTKLGVGGLINAYKTATEQAIENASITTIIPQVTIKLSVDFGEISALNQTLKQNQTSILNEAYDTSYNVFVRINEEEMLNLSNLFQHITTIKINEV